MAKHSTGGSSGSGGRHQAAGQGERDARQIRHATRTVSAATSKTTRGGKPSVIGHATSGAVGGASAGAALGSIVPGIGTAVGAGTGAAVGAAGGAVGGAGAKRAARLAGRSPGQRALVAEFCACVLILGLSPLTDKHKQDTPGQWMRRATGISALFIILGLISGAGPRAARAAAGLGGLVLVTLAVSDRDIFTVVATRFGGPLYSGPAGPDGGGGGSGDFGPVPGVPDGGAPPPGGGGLPTTPGVPGWRGPF